MRGDFERVMRPLLKHEGGKVNDPHDPGGRTNKGVTQRVYDAYRAKRGQKPRTVYSIEDREVKEIYREQYWAEIWGDDLPDGLDYLIFDAAVNSGTTQAIKWAQRAAGITPVDGHMGVRTTASLQAIDDENAEADFIDRYSKLRLSFMMSLRTWGRFGPGWKRRVAEVQKLSLLMVDNQPTTAAERLISAEPARASIEDANISDTPTGSLATQQASIASGGIFATVMGYFYQANDWLSNLTGLAPETTKLILGFVGGGALMIILGFSGLAIYQEIQRRRSGESRII